MVGEEEGEDEVIVGDGEAEAVGGACVAAGEGHHVVEDCGLLSPERHPEPTDAADHLLD